MSSSALSGEAGFREKFPNRGPFGHAGDNPGQGIVGGGRVGQDMLGPGPPELGAPKYCGYGRRYGQVVQYAWSCSFQVTTLP